MIGVFL